MRKFNYVFTKCRAKFKGHKEMNYTFYIVDHIYGEHPIDIHITELRNKRLINTAYFMDEGKAGMFIATEGGRISLSAAHNGMFVKSVKKFKSKIIDNIFEKRKE